MPEFIPEPPELEFEYLSREGNYHIFNLVGWGANVKHMNDKNERSVWAKYETPPDKLVKVAIPLFPGAGPQPENSITTIDVEDMIFDALKRLESALNSIETSKKGDSW